MTMCSRTVGGDAAAETAVRLGRDGGRQLGVEKIRDVVVDLVGAAVGNREVRPRRAGIGDAVADIAVAVACRHAQLGVLARDIAEYPVDRPAGARIRLADPRDQPRQVAAAIVRPHPGDAAGDHDPGNPRRGLRRDDAALAAILAVEHRAGLLGQVGVPPIIEAAAEGRDDLAVGVFARHPERVFRHSASRARVEHVEQRIPVAARRLLPVQEQQFVEIVPHPQMQPELARRPVARDEETAPAGGAGRARS